MAGADEVDAFMAALQHPLKAEVAALRAIVLAADPRVSEGIKWKAPSFRLEDDFATFQLRRPDAVQIVFHTGAKARPGGPRPMAVEDPSKLLTWAASDRALAAFKDMGQVRRDEVALTALVRAWIAAL
jgi:hypothetical protein